MQQRQSLASRIGTIVGIVLFLSAYAWMSNDDLKQRERSEQDMRDAVIAARQAAHEKAEDLRRRQLLDDANRMLYPIAQATVK